jgi:2-keto-4-pentenoate hydratase/2-oxohepta-3-ene-1,7-dioic acid hydratase in catechol pathway
MKLARYGPAGLEKPGVIDGHGALRDLSHIVPDIDPDTLPGLRSLIPVDLNSLPLVDGTPRYGCPVARPGKIVSVGLNYRDHCEEVGYPIPSEPILFSKAITSLSGPNDDVILPRGCTKTDWEVEFAIVIGQKAQYVDERDAMNYVAGFSVINDITERRFQLEREGQWFKGKGCDTFAPIGPWLVTPDEVSDFSDRKLWLKVNGKVMQNSSTKHLIFGVAHLVSYISEFMTLLPGDCIATGTPPGVGLGMKPNVWLQPGDVMALGVEGLGEQRQQVRAYST